MSEDVLTPGDVKVLCECESRLAFAYMRAAGAVRFGSRSLRISRRKFFQWLDERPKQPTRYRPMNLDDVSALTVEQRITLSSAFSFEKCEATLMPNGKPCHPPLVKVLRKPVSAEMRAIVYGRDSFRCVYCGRTEPNGVRLTIDHIVPPGRGGSEGIENLVTACAICNSRKTGYLPEECHMPILFMGTL
jgi:hypothetical protein